RGTISDEEARKRLPEPRRRRDSARVDLASMAPPVKLIEVHPAAVKRYLDAISDLAATLSRRIIEGDEEVVCALRELVVAVLVHPAGRDEPKIEVTGRLANLTGCPDLFPQQTIPTTAVAGAGIEPATYGL